MVTVGFRHGALSDTYEKQANDQGFTFGDDAEWVQKVGFGLVCALLSAGANRENKECGTSN